MFRAARSPKRFSARTCARNASHMAQQKGFTNQIAMPQPTQTQPIAAKQVAAKLDEGAFFGLYTDWGNGTAVPSVTPNKGAFFGLHTDWGNDSNYLTTVTEPDEGALFALHTDWGDGTKVRSVKLSPKGAFFGLHTDWGKTK